MAVERTFDTGVITLNYAEGGASDRPVVLLHGSTRHWQDFERIIPHLEGQWHVFALDFRGHGKSGRMPGHYRLRDNVDDVMRFLDAVVREPSVLIGASLGALVGVMVAARRSVAVRGLVLLDPPLYIEEVAPPLVATFLAWRELLQRGLPPESLARELENFRAPFPGREVPVRYGDVLSAKGLREMAECFAKLDPELFTTYAEAFAEFRGEYDPEELLPRVECPVLLLHGKPALGSAITEGEVARALAALPDGRHRQFNAGHELLLQRPEVVLRETLAFLGSLRS